MVSQGDILQEHELFSRCLDYPEAEWEAVLATHCDDDGLRARVLRLLERHRNTDNAGAGFLRLNAEDPEQIGSYCILQRLDEGGMGIVYAAEQREPVRRRVAIKVLRAGYNNREVLARFDAERQALALMSHPNIARIFDAGATDAGQPFIVMEFVRGEPITRYCEQRNLLLKQRLSLFRQVCEAVQHAHQKGVIHRDLKPSNILVTEEAGTPLPKVIDFGIAKAIAQPLTERTLETKIGSLLGTPEYMSPEQAELSADIDTRSDVYALGAVLYHLLVGVPPLDLDSRNYTDMQRCIREQQPLPPSRRVGGVLQRRLRGELDWIIMKALEKDRVRRYASPAEFAADIASHLANRTVSAGPPGRLRSLGKFLHRHWLATASITAIVVTLTVSQVLVLQKNRELAAERDRANRETEIANRVTQFTASLFELSSPNETGAPDVTARELLDAGVERLEREMTDQPDGVRAVLLTSAADAYHGLGLHAEAERLAERAVQLHRHDPVTDPIARVVALVNLAHLKQEHGDLKVSIELAQEAVAVAEVENDARLMFHARVALAEALRHDSRLDEAGDILAASIADARRGTYVDATGFSNALVLLGQVRTQQSRFAEAEQLLREANAREAPSSRQWELAQGALSTLYKNTGRRELAAEIDNALVDAARRRYGDIHTEVAIALNNLGNTLALIPGREAETERVLREALDIDLQTLGPDHGRTLTVQSNLAWLYRHVGKLERAQEMYSRIVEKRTRLLGPNHLDTANAKAGLGLVKLKLGDAAAAEQLYREALATQVHHLGERQHRTASFRRVLGQALTELGRFDEAEVELRKAHTVILELLGPEHAQTLRAAEALDTLAKARMSAVER